MLVKGGEINLSKICVDMQIQKLWFHNKLYVCAIACGDRRQGTGDSIC